MIGFVQTVAIGIAATNDALKRSSKVYKEQEALRRSQMTIEERRHEDLCKLSKRIANS
jgi:hypothetical protein